MIPLKKCPFCGVKITFGSSMEDNEKINHPDNGCYMRRCINALPPCRSPKMREEMAEGWNRRYLDDGDGKMCELKPCPFCRSRFQVMHIDRMRISYISCSGCSARVEIDGTHCSDPHVHDIVNGLYRMWNRREKDD